MEDLPFDIRVAILNKVKLSSLIGDLTLERFVVKYVDVDTQEMLYALVKNKRLEALTLYILNPKHVGKVRCVSSHCIKQVIELSIRQKSFTITIILCKAFAKANRLDGSICHKVVTCVVNGYFQALSQVISEGLLSECIVCKAHIAFLEYFLVLCRLQGVCSDKLVRRSDLVQWLGKKSSHHILEVLLKNKCLSHIFDTIVDNGLDSRNVKMINAVIGNNSLSILKAMVENGYKVIVCDVIVGIAMSNYEMLEYLCKYFKPRWYSKKFRAILLSIASKRNDDRILQLIRAKLYAS